MLNINNSSDKFHLVIGLGRSGYWAAKFLNSKNKRVIVLEEQNNDQFKTLKKELEIIGIEVFLNIRFEFKEISHLIKHIECVILSPVIHSDNKTVNKLKDAGIKLIGEMNLGWSNLEDINWVGVTGTNGKTTVTHLLSHILSQNNLKAPSAGNIGKPICKYAYEYNKNKKFDWIIAELSSYQIEIAKEIRPKIGIWTTFTPDHLERHKTLENYFNIKNQLLIGSEIRIYNYDDKYLRSHEKYLAKGTWISADLKSKSSHNCDFWIDNSGFVVEKGKQLFKSNIFKLRGKHNLQNLLLATSAARKIGLNGDSIKNSLKTYKPLPHRFESIYKSENIEIINDSKATNFDSSIAAINSLLEKQIIIAGGKIKEGNYKKWAKTIMEKCEVVFLYGENAQELKQILLAAGFQKSIFIHVELKTLIPQAINLLEKGKAKVLLFSPSCSSFDQFKNYEERGNTFKSYIHKFFTKGRH